jgi:amino acid transporter
MANAKKFGAFAGVFAPSVLTILGVIMYLRLGWVVGEAGLLIAIVIIMIAHIISVSTGLSVSSISTDRKVKAGGLYYILSRSLGLPIGGAIGMALFVGTALSIALYVIGFSESLLNFLEWGSEFEISQETLSILSAKGVAQSTINQLFTLKNQRFVDIGLFIQNIHQILDIEAVNTLPIILKHSRIITTADLRIVGSVTALVITAIAFISTSLALRMQFFILGAIVLSLFSVFLGANEFHVPDLSFSLSGSANFALIFAVFFPAVTGFTAGVAMSGDLKDPKKNIPQGTMWAIGVGLVVYIALAIYMAFTIPADVLRTDNNILEKVGFLPAGFILAGIWGATLSSALGGILGAPRIIQAMSMDRIAPRILAKEAGKDNEPRNALLLTFVLAEMGILIGELNTIAEVVSMFYLTAYGFINLSSALESWASSDFRPQFRIPRFVSIIGAIFTFFVMIVLNLTAMLVSFAIIIAIFLYLSRREISLGHGDVWEGVWASIVRRGIAQISQQETKQRNWRPNIILFSGGEKRRPYLVEFGKSLIGKLGFLSDFRLVELPNGKKLFSKTAQLVNTEKENSDGVFKRRHECNNIYEGMETIARNYGFAGIDPNTILLGWSSRAKNPKALVRSIQSMQQLDYNVLLFKYSEKYHFGKKQSIDIWWRGKGNNGNFMLALLRFIQMSPEWRNANFRFLIVNHDSSRRNIIYKNMGKMLDEARIGAKIKIINNEVEQHSFFNIIRAESQFTDLVILGLPDIQEDKYDDFIYSVNMMTEQLERSMLLVKASSYFNEMSTAEESSQVVELISNAGESLTSKEEKMLIKNTVQLDLSAVKPPKNIALANLSVQKNQLLEEIILEFLNKYLEKNYQTQIELICDFESLFKDQYQKLSENPTKREVQKVEFDFLRKAQKLLKKYGQGQLVLQAEQLREAKRNLFSKLNLFLGEVPVQMSVFYEKKYFDQEPQKSELVHFSVGQRLAYKFSKNALVFEFEYKKMLTSYLQGDVYFLVYELFQNFTKSSRQHNAAVRKLLHDVKNSFQILSLTKEESAVDNLKTSSENINDEIQDIKANIQKSFEEDAQVFIQGFSNFLNDLTINLDNFQNNRKINKDAEEKYESLKEIPTIWLKNQRLLLNMTHLDAHLLLFQEQFKILVAKLEKNILQIIDREGSQSLKNLSVYLNDFQLKELNENSFEVAQLIDNQSDRISFRSCIKKFMQESKELILTYPQKAQLINEEASKSKSIEIFDVLEASDISLQTLFDYLIQTHFVQPLLQNIDALPQKITQATNAVEEVTRLFAFTVQDQKLQEADIQVLIEDSMKRCVKEEEELLQVKYKLGQEIALFSQQTLDYFNPYSVNKVSGNLTQYLRSGENKKALSSIEKTFQKGSDFVKESITQLWYRRSDGLLIARKLEELNERKEAEVEDILNFVEKISPKKEVLNNLPFYYTQLFTNKDSINQEFVFERKEERKQAQKAIERFSSGASGALMITGETNSGKSLLSKQIAENFSPKKQVYYINPPKGGSIEPSIFKKSFEKSLQIQGEYTKLISKLPFQSVLVFNDVELWWERSQKGFAVFELLLNLIDNYANRYLFILNSGSRSFEFINKVHKIKDSFLDIIKCESFSAEELKNIIIFRHKSSPITFKLGKTDENDMTSWKYARLFTKYFDYSQGNIGMALQAWVNHIENVEGSTLQISEPRIPNTQILREMPSDWMVMIVQFILHKSLTINRLTRIMQLEKEDVQKQVRILKRAGVIQEQNKVLRINRYLEPILIWELVHLKVI